MLYIDYLLNKKEDFINITLVPVSSSLCNDGIYIDVDDLYHLVSHGEKYIGKYKYLYYLLFKIGRAKMCDGKIRKYGDRIKFFSERQKSLKTAYDIVKNDLDIIREINKRHHNNYNINDLFM